MSAEQRRLFAPELPALGGEVRLGADAARHAKVLRLKRGDDVWLFDGRGLEARSTITHVDPDALVCRAEAPAELEAHLPRVVLVQAWPKGGKLDAIVRMATEIGVAAIHLALSERSVARPDERRLPARVDRLERIAREASRQARRADVPVLIEPAPLLEVATRAPDVANRVVLWEREDYPFGGRLDPDAPETWLCVGPEGGLAEAEVNHLRALAWQSAGLGPTILRVETAAPVAVALALAHLTSVGRFSF